MFKVLIARIRGKACMGGKAWQNVAADERHPLIVLDRQRIDAEGRVDLARRHLAVTDAARQAEAGRLAAADRRIAALEHRAVQALAEGRAPVARQSAEMIARLSADRVWTLAVVRASDAEAGRLTRNLATAEAHLARVLRAGRIVRAEEVVRQLRESTARRRGFDAMPDAPLAEAEATLARLRARQAESLPDEAVRIVNRPMIDRPAGMPSASAPSAAEILVALRNRVTMASQAA
jgi:phage shock protein A